MFEMSVFERMIHLKALVVGLVVAIPMTIAHMRQGVDAPAFDNQPVHQRAQRIGRKIESVAPVVERIEQDFNSSRPSWYPVEFFSVFSSALCLCGESAFNAKAVAESEQALQSGSQPHKSGAGKWY